MENRINKIHGQLIEDVRVPEIEKRVVQLEEGGQGGAGILPQIYYFVFHTNTQNIDENSVVVRIDENGEQTQIKNITTDVTYVNSINNDFLAGKSVVVAVAQSSFTVDEIGDFAPNENGFTALCNPGFETCHEVASVSAVFTKFKKVIEVSDLQTHGASTITSISFVCTGRFSRDTAPTFNPYSHSNN